jgi:hypothetical protein
MASALNSVAANNASGNASAGAPNPGRSTLRSSNSTKGSDNRRQSGSPIDGGQRYVQPFLLDSMLNRILVYLHFLRTWEIPLCFYRALLLSYW